MESTTTGSAPHFAPGGFVNGLPIVGPATGVSITNAICLPSGDHVISLGASVRLVMFAVSPRVQRIAICVCPSVFLDRYAIRDPSGDQCGDEWDPGPVASGVCAPVAGIDEPQRLHQLIGP